MNNNEKYDLLSEGDVGLPSIMGIFPNNISFSLNFDKMRVGLESAKDFKLVSINKTEDSVDFPDQSCAMAEIEYQGEMYDIELCVFSTDGLDLRNYSFGNKIAESDMKIAMQQKYYLETNMHFRSNALTSFHLQLKIMNSLVPDASLIVDFSSLRLLSARWFRMTAKSSIAPSPDYLYIIHGVYDKKDDRNEYWLHTHGLHRCRLVELEMLGITDGANEMHTLLNMIVKKYLSGISKENESFTIGYDGMGINMAWLRWEEALKDFPDNVLGSLKDRLHDSGEPDVHAEPSGVLFAVEDGNMISPQIYVKTLSDNPIYYITDEETQRMSDLAKERFAMYENIFRQHGVAVPEKKSFMGKLFSKKEDKETQWSFLVKLGLTVDDISQGSEKEHLWFEVKNITKNNEIEGLLINQPYWIARLNEGDIGTYPLDMLTDWMIYGPDSQYTPDTIYELGFS